MKKNKSSLVEIIKYYVKDKVVLSLSILTIIASIVSGWLAVQVPKLVQELLTKHILKDTDSQLWHFAIWIISVILIYAIVIAINGKLGSYTTSRVTAKIREDAYDKYIGLDHYYYDKVDSGDILSKISRDVEKTAQAGINTYRQVFGSIVTIIYGINAMWGVSGKLTLFTLGFLVLFPLVFMPLGFLHHKTEKEFVKDNAKGTQQLHVSINGIKLIKAFATELVEITKFKKFTKAYRRSFDRKEFYMSLMMTFGMVLFSVIQVGILIVGAFLIRNKEVQFGDVVSFFLFANTLISPLMSIFMISPRLNEGKAAMSSILELFEASNKVDMNLESNTDDVDGNIVFKNVNFKYNDDLESYQLKDFSFDFKKGRKYAVVGPSGAGKSTLINLLPKFYNISTGSIEINNINLNEFNIEKLRKKIGIVQQDIFIFPGTIKENIAYGFDNVSDEIIIEAAKNANIHDDIMKMENGYNTNIGENGVKLSGGQKQRVSIARMFLKDPEILILDEATSALDTITEYKIQQSFEKLMSNRTSITIAHRLSTIVDSDEILVIDDGRLQVSGSHQDLVSEEGLYKELYRSIERQNQQILKK